MDSSGEDGGFEDGVFGAIETEEVAIAALLDRVGSDEGSFLRVVESIDVESVPATGVGEDEAVEFGQGVGLTKGGLGEKQHVVGNVKDAVARAFKIFVSRRSAVRTEDELGNGDVNDRSHRRDVYAAIFVLCRDDAFENTAITAKLRDFVGHSIKK